MQKIEEVLLQGCPRPVATDRNAHAGRAMGNVVVERDKLVAEPLVELDFRYGQHGHAAALRQQNEDGQQRMGLDAEARQGALPEDAFEDSATLRAGAGSAAAGVAAGLESDLKKLLTGSSPVLGVTGTLARGKTAASIMRIYQ